MNDAQLHCPSCYEVVATTRNMYGYYWSDNCEHCGHAYKSIELMISVGDVQDSLPKEFFDEDEAIDPGQMIIS